MSGIVWSKFFWSDWESDPRLKLCSLAAQGLWMRVLCVCAQSDRYAAEIDGLPLSTDDIAVIVGRPAREVKTLLTELEGKGVFSRAEDGAIFSRRMQRDAEKRAADQANGRKGGNPRVKGDRTPPDNGGVNPPRNPSGGGGDKAHKPEAKSQGEGKPPKRAFPSPGAAAPRDETRAAAAVGEAGSNVVDLQAQADWLAKREAILNGTEG